MLRKTKIICTIGPASDNVTTLSALANAGMTVARLNFSHENHEKHKKTIATIREASDAIQKPIAIMLDTKGPEIRCGVMENDMLTFEKGDILRLVKEEVIGNNERIHVSGPELFTDIEVGNYLLIDDGKMKLTVLEKKADEMTCRIETPGVIKTRKGINVPGVKLTMPFISEKDEADIRFGCAQDVDIIAASFVRHAQDVLDLRKILEEEGKPNIQICAKIENQEGYDNLDEILEVVDSIMVARGDLGVEVNIAYVPIYQKKMIAKANEYGKHVITATHMLESMMSNPCPTRAEANDIANAILDGTDSIMLSGESAAGLYPVESTAMMDTIAISIEEIIPYRERLELLRRTSYNTIQDAIGISVADSTLTLDNVAAIIAFTQSGDTARRISKYRPNVPIIAATFSKHVQRSLLANWGVLPIVLEEQNEMYNDGELACKIAKENGVLPGQLIIITAGYPTGVGSANMMKIIEVK